MSGTLTAKQREMLERMMMTTCEACNLTGRLAESIIVSEDPFSTMQALMEFLRQMNAVRPEGSDQALETLNNLAVEMGIPLRMFGLETNGMVH